MSTLKSSAEDLTLNADGSGNDIIFQSNGSNVATLDQAGLLTATTFAGSGASLTALPAAQLTGSLPAISGASLTGIASKGKNIIINGGMKVWQRSTSEAAVTSTYNTADRWYTTIAAGGVWTQSKATGTAGFASAIKMDCTTADASLAAGDRLMLSYNIEGQNLQHLKKGTASAESVTLQFWVKSPKTGTHIIEVYDHDNSRHICQAYTVSSADTWEQKTLTFAGDTTGAFGDDINNSCTIQFYMAAGTNYTSGTLATSWASSSNVNRAVGQVNCADNTSNDFYLTGVQLELGSTATDFEHKTFGEELALCHRYCFMPINAGTATGKRHLRDGYFWGADEVDMGWEFPVTMRTAPTLTQVTGDDYFIIETSVCTRNLDNAWSIQQAHSGGCNCYTAPESNGTAGTPGNIVKDDNAARFGFVAEL